MTSVVEKNTPMSPVLSISRSTHHNLNNSLTPFFEKVLGVDINNLSLIACPKTELEANKQIVSQDVINLNASVPGLV